MDASPDLPSKIRGLTAGEGMILEWEINGMIGMVGIRDDENTNETFVFFLNLYW